MSEKWVKDDHLGLKKSPWAPGEFTLVRWHLHPDPGNDDRTIRDTAFDSKMRNVIDPSG